MMKVEGSTDGVTWVAFAIKAALTEPREAAASSLLKPKHTYDRSVEA